MTFLFFLLLSIPCVLVGVLMVILSPLHGWHGDSQLDRLLSGVGKREFKRLCRGENPFGAVIEGALMGVYRKACGLCRWRIRNGFATHQNLPGHTVDANDLSRTATFPHLRGGRV